MKSFWANNGDPNWKMLVFAKNRQEAKKIAYKHMPFPCYYIDVRVWLTNQKWMKFYEGSDVIFSMPEMTDETWEDWLSRWEAKNEV